MGEAAEAKGSWKRRMMMETMRRAKWVLKKYDKVQVVDDNEGDALKRSYYRVRLAHFIERCVPTNYAGQTRDILRKELSNLTCTHFRPVFRGRSIYDTDYVDRY